MAGGQTAELLDAGKQPHEAFAIPYRRRSHGMGSRRLDLGRMIGRMPWVSSSSGTEPNGSIVD